MCRPLTLYRFRMQFGSSNVSLDFNIHTTITDCFKKSIIIYNIILKVKHLNYI